MPQRFLRPGITTSDAWNGVSWPCQSFFIRLLTLVDDYGRYDGRIAILHGQCFPLRPDINPQETAALRSEAQRAGLIDVYENEGKEYVQVLKWQERARGASRYPEPSAGIRRNPQDSAADSCLPSPSPSPSPSHRSSPEPIHSQVASLLDRIGTIYKRKPGSLAKEPEERAALDVVKRPEWKSELVEVLQFDKVIAQEDRKYKIPQTLYKLLEDWTGTLDKARSYAGCANGSVSHAFAGKNMEQAQRLWEKENPGKPTSQFIEAWYAYEDSRP